MKHGDCPIYSNKHTPTDLATKDLQSLKHKVQSIIRISKRPKKVFEHVLIHQKVFESEARESNLNDDLIVT